MGAAAALALERQVLERAHARGVRARQPLGRRRLCARGRPARRPRGRPERRALCGRGRGGLRGRGRGRDFRSCARHERRRVPRDLRRPLNALLRSIYKVLEKHSQVSPFLTFAFRITMFCAAPVSR